MTTCANCDRLTAWIGHLTRDRDDARSERDDARARADQMAERVRTLYTAASVVASDLKVKHAHYEDAHLDPKPKRPIPADEATWRRLLDAAVDGDNEAVESQTVARLEVAVERAESAEEKARKLNELLVEHTVPLEQYQAAVERSVAVEAALRATEFQHSTAYAGARSCRVCAAFAPSHQPDCPIGNVLAGGTAALDALRAEDQREVAALRERSVPEGWRVEHFIPRADRSVLWLRATPSQAQTWTWAVSRVSDAPRTGEFLTEPIAEGVAQTRRAACDAADKAAKRTTTPADEPAKDER